MESLWVLFPLLTSSPEGQCFVLGPALFMNLLTNRMFANVPLAITASLPRLDPYELNSLGVRPRSAKNLAAGLFLEIIPAGDM